MDWWGLAKGGTKTFARLAAAFVPGAGFLEQALKLIDSGSEEEAEKAAKAFQRQVKSYHLDQLQHTEQFEKTFAEAIQLADIDRLVVFVDDLDRCLPEKAIQILEAIKLFLEVKDTVFVLGMDKEVVVQGLETRYHQVREGSKKEQVDDERQELPISGDAYLQKMVQLPFHLPPLGLGDIEGYMSKLEKDLTRNEKLPDMTYQVLARGLYPNPRQVKRSLNTFRLLRGLVEAREERYLTGDKEGGLEPEKIAWPLLAKAMLIQQQWPGLYRDWRGYPILVPMLEEEYAKHPLSHLQVVRGEAETVDKLEELPDEDAVGKDAGRASQRDVQPGGLLEPYFKYRRKYRRLEQMLTFPPAGETGEGRDRALFEGLLPADIEPYLLLVSAAVESQPDEDVQVSESLMDDLLSGDAVKVKNALAQLAGADEAAQEAQRPALQRSLRSVMRDVERPAAARVSAGNALSEIGDPRFDSELWYLPDDPLVGFRQVPAGTFLIGSAPDDDQAADDEKPQEKLTLQDYYIVRYPVTVAQFMGKGFK